MLSLLFNKASNINYYYKIKMNINNKFTNLALLLFWISFYMSKTNYLIDHENNTLSTNSNQI